MRIWHLARFGVVDHVRSSKLVVEALLIGGFLVFFWDHPGTMGREDFFMSTGLFLMLLAGVESYLFLGRAADRRFHLVLAHIARRRAALLGLFLAVTLVVGAVTLGFVLAGAVVLREIGASAYLGGVVLLAINLLTTIALCFLFSPLAVGSNLGWVALALIVFGFSRDAFLLGPGSGLLGWLAGFFHELLPPFYETINAAEGHPDVAAPVVAGLHQLFYGALALGLALWRFQQRELEPVD